MKPFTKWLSRCGGKWTCISCFLAYADHQLSHLLWSVLHDLGPVRIPSHSMKTLHKTFYKMVKLLWRYVNLYFTFFSLCSRPSSPHWLSQKRNRVHMQPPSLLILSILCIYIGQVVQWLVCFLEWMVSHEISRALCLILDACTFFATRF